MNNLSKDKRDKLILTCLLAAGLAGALYTFVLAAQKDRLSVLKRQVLIARDKVSKAERLLQNAKTIEAALQENEKVLDEREEAMAPHGQYYYWFLKQIEQFREKEKLDPGFIADISQPEFSDAGLLPNFPYKAATFGLRLNGHFQDVGRFIADLENTFPYFRIQSVKLAPLNSRNPAAPASPAGLAGLVVPAGDDRLAVELRVVTLARGGTT